MTETAEERERREIREYRQSVRQYNHGRLATEALEQALLALLQAEGKLSIAAAHARIGDATVIGDVNPLHAAGEQVYQLDVRLRAYHDRMVRDHPLPVQRP